MQHYLVAVDHYKFGWFLFLIMLVPLFLVGRFFEKLEYRQGISLDERPIFSGESLPPGVLARRIAISVLILSIAPVTGVVLDRRADQIDHASLMLPRSVGDWRWQSPPSPVWEPNFMGAAQEVIGKYVLDDEHIDIYANLYTRQRQGAELIGNSNSLFDNSNWREVSNSAVSLELMSGRTMNAKQLEVTSWDRRKQFYIYWYLVDGNVVVNSVKVKLKELSERLKGRAASRIVAVRFECQLDCEHRRKMVLSFLSAHSEAINSQLSSSFTSDDDVLAGPK